MTFQCLIPKPQTYISKNDFTCFYLQGHAYHYITFPGIQESMALVWACITSSDGVKDLVYREKVKSNKDA